MGIALGQVQGVDRGLAVVDAGVEVADVGVQDEVVDRLVDALKLDPVDLGVDVLIDRGFGDDAGDLITVVDIVEAGQVELQRAR